MEETISFEDMFEIVVQPDHSKNVLNRFQNKYNMSTLDFLSYYKEGIVPIPAIDANRWLHQLSLFITAEGDLGELIDSRYSCSYCNTTSYEDFYYTSCAQKGQPGAEEVIATSFFI